MSSILIWSLFGIAFSHMHMSVPAAEGSRGNSGGGIEVNYDINSPISANQISNPCKYPARNKPIETYTAGQSISVSLVDNITRGGGHCQFGFSYDRSNFAIIHTVTGDCPLSKFYQVPIPASAPNGVVTFIWGWNNKVGNREMYINCAEIEIKGGSGGGFISGKKLLITNVGGDVKFPEVGFSKELGDQVLGAQPPITVSPLGSIPNNQSTGDNSEVITEKLNTESKFENDLSNSSSENTQTKDFDENSQKRSSIQNSQANYIPSIKPQHDYQYLQAAGNGDFYTLGSNQDIIPTFESQFQSTDLSESIYQQAHHINKNQNYVDAEHNKIKPNYNTGSNDQIARQPQLISVDRQHQFDTDTDYSYVFYQQ